MLLRENCFSFSSSFKPSQQWHTHKRGYLKKLAAISLVADTSSLCGTATPGNTAGHFQKLGNQWITFQWFIGTVRVGVPFTTNYSIPFSIVRYLLASTKENHLKAKPVISKKGKFTSLIWIKIETVSTAFYIIVKVHKNINPLLVCWLFTIQKHGWKYSEIGDLRVFDWTTILLTETN